jgi:hypothetical protein
LAKSSQAAEDQGSGSGGDPAQESKIHVPQILHEALLSQYNSPCFSPQHQLQERLRSENYRQAAHGSSFQEC